MRIGIILDRMELRRWQREALERIAGTYEFIIYNCTSPHQQRKRLRHALYYALNVWAIWNRMTQRVAVADKWSVVSTHNFKAISVGAWQELPPELLQQIREDQPLVLIKFGMGLLRVPPSEEFSVPILSYHHGDPTRFRGRPAGFYELLEGEPTIGQVVQVLSNTLDGGGIVAAGETKTIAHSYRATLVEAFRRSPLLLAPAIANCVKGYIQQPPSLGRNYRLPNNSKVVEFVLKLASKAIRRLIYGLFFEKRWKVATADLPKERTVDAIATALADSENWATVPIPSGYSFLADPFIHPGGGLLVEAMNKRTLQGEILHISPAGCRRVSFRHGHHSYPATIELAGQIYMVPEITDWSEPIAFSLAGSEPPQTVEIGIPGGAKLLDPTPFMHDSGLYVFGSVLQEGNSVLRLWVGDTICGPLSEHPSSPLRISPKGARMAGTPFILGDRLIRVGQDFRGEYGDGICLFAIEQLDREQYCERLIAEFKFSQCRGPHTLNISSTLLVFDYYTEVFSLLAGIRRIRQRAELQLQRTR